MGYSSSQSSHGLYEHQHRVFWADEYIPEGVRNWACQNTGGFESACQNTGVFEHWRTGIQVLVKPSLPYTDLERTCVCGSSAVGYLRKASSLLGHTSFHTLRAVVPRGRREKG
ncbi:hypothetical protein SRHO_G00016530 [Serrasalmus rhombeus]